MIPIFENEFKSIIDNVDYIPLDDTTKDHPPIVAFSKRKNAPIQLLFVGHLDTVFSKNNSFQKCTIIDKNKIQGPGIIDMKSGITILLKAITHYELYHAVRILGGHFY